MRSAPVLLLVASLCAAPAVVRAQAGALQVEQLEPLPAGSGILNVATSDVLPHNAWAIDAWVGYSLDPLPLTPADSSDDRSGGSVLPAQVRTELIVGYGLFDIGEITLAAPLTTNTGEPDYGIGGRAPSEMTGSAAGDIRLLGAANLTRYVPLPDGMGLGAGLALWFPTGDTDRFAGEGSLRFEPRLFADWGNRGGWRAAANVAWHVRPESKVFSYVNDDVLRWSLAGSAPTGVHALEALTVVHGAYHPFEQPDPTDATQSVAGSVYDPIEALAGVRYGLPFGAEITVALGAGLTSGIGAPLFRALTQLGWGLPNDRGRLPSYAAARDTDEDGLSDFDDDCPYEAELMDGRRDHDGCPEAGPEVLAMLKFDVAEPAVAPEEEAAGEEAAEVAEPEPVEAKEEAPAEEAAPPKLPPLVQFKDADSDGLADGEDDCPEEAEDEDGFRDFDGCPDPDDDLDGIADADDKCRFQAETRNGFEDEDGCPDLGPDEDKDGIGDFYDLCPLEAETVDGVRDADGCPEADEEELLAQIALWEKLPPPPVSAPVAVVAPQPEPAQDWLADKLPALLRLADTDGDGIMDEFDQCPTEKETVDDFRDADGCPDPDDDLDGIADADDKCRFEAETFNLFEDEDGCPDQGPDEDKDGIGDIYDHCPLIPENVDGVRDWDGCPEADMTALKLQVAEWEKLPEPKKKKKKAKKKPEVDLPPPDLPPLERSGDVDGDGLAEVDDLCPELPEDLDGFEDFDGCPDLDDDQDGVADAHDLCRRVAESRNGFEDHDGCPDTTTADISALAGVQESIRFKKGSSVLVKKAKPVLEKVAELLVKHPELRLRIEGHTDSLGSKSENQKLSEQRAAAVRKWLIKKGIAAERLEAVGKGETEPRVKVKGRKKKGHAKNRRVELEYLSAPAAPAPPAGEDAAGEEDKETETP